MQSMPSPPSLLLSNQSAPSLWRHFLRDWRKMLLGVFLSVAALLAPPGLGLGALIWWRSSKTWDYREHWAGIWMLAIIGVVVYAALTWVAHPLPSLLHSLLVDRQHSVLVAGVQAVGTLWLLHLCFAPACALILEWLHPLTRRVCLLPRYRVLQQGKAGMAPTDGPPADVLPLVAALHASPSCSASLLSSPSFHSSPSS